MDFPDHPAETPLPIRWSGNPGGPVTGGSGGRGLVDVTVGSALDLFGGKGLCDKDLVRWNRRLA